jgi:hypothetical protein
MTVEIEKLTRRRRMVLTTSGLLFIILQPTVYNTLDAPMATWRVVDWVKASSFALWSAMLILILLTGGFPFRKLSQATRSALNDELTRDNRRVGYMAGYWAMMIAAAVLFALAQADFITPSECLRYLFAIGVAFPAIRFAALERRQDG